MTVFKADIATAKAGGQMVDRFWVSDNKRLLPSSTRCALQGWGWASYTTPQSQPVWHHAATMHSVAHTCRLADGLTHSASACPKWSSQ